MRGARRQYQHVIARSECRRARGLFGVILFAGPGRALVRVDVRAEVVVRDGPGFLVKLRPVAAALPLHDQSSGVN